MTVGLNKNHKCKNINLYFGLRCNTFGHKCYKNYKCNKSYKCNYNIWLQMQSKSQM